MTKERMKQYRDLKQEQVQIQAQLKGIETTLQILEAKGIIVSSLSAKYGRLMAVYQRKLEELAAEQLAIEHAIDSLGSLERQVLRLYYIDGLEWKDVCTKIGYEWAQTHRIHSNALKALKQA